MNVSEVDRFTTILDPKEVASYSSMYIVFVNRSDLVGLFFETIVDFKGQVCRVGG